MGCACTDKKKQDYDYVRRLANAESITNKVDVQIYFIIGFDGKTKYYDYEESTGGRRLNVVETIRFQQYQGSEILPDIEQSELGIVSNEEVIAVVEKVTGTNRKPKRVVAKSVSSDSGTVLQGD